MISIIWAAVILLGAGSFFLQNQEQHVTVRYLFGMGEASTPLNVPILSAFAVGLALGTAMLLPAWIRGRLELRRMSRTLTELQADLEQFRRTIEKAMPKDAMRPGEEQARGPMDE